MKVWRWIVAFTLWSSFATYGFAQSVTVTSPILYQQPGNTAYMQPSGTYTVATGDTGLSVDYTYERKNILGLWKPATGTSSLIIGGTGGPNNWSSSLKWFGGTSGTEYRVKVELFWTKPDGSQGGPVTAYSTPVTWP